MRSKKVFLSVFGRLAVVVVLAAVATLPAAAQLTGTYFATVDYTCLVSPSGFTNLTPAGTGAFVQWANLQGTLRFQANGTGSGENFKGMTISGTGFANSEEESFSFTYTAGAGGTLTIQDGSLSGTLLTGPVAGDTFTVENLPPESGQIASNGTATLTTTNPTVETAIVTTPTGSVSYPRICHRTVVLIPEQSVCTGSECALPAPATAVTKR